MNLKEEIVTGGKYAIRRDKYHFLECIVIHLTIEGIVSSRLSFHRIASTSFLWVFSKSIIGRK